MRGKFAKASCRFRAMYRLSARRWHSIQIRKRGTKYRDVKWPITIQIIPTTIAKGTAITSRTAAMFRGVRLLPNEANSTFRARAFFCLDLDKALPLLKNLYPAIARAEVLCL